MAEAKEQLGIEERHLNEPESQKFQNQSPIVIP